MNQKFDFKQEASFTMKRARDAANRLMIGGMVHMEHWRPRKSGTMRKIGDYDFHNDITNEGKNLILDVMFHDVTQIAAASWFAGLISLASYSALAAADVMNSHAGWLEFTGYSESTRQAWGPGAAASQAITNASAMVFSINATGTVKGLFITSSSTKSGTTGKLWATALYSGDVAVSSGDEIRSNYNLSC